MSAAADRLARSRLALIEYVQRKEERSHRRGPLASLLGRGEAGPPPDEAGVEAEGDIGPWADAAAGGGGMAGGLRRALRSWWRHHPARLGLQVATPALSSYGGRKPLQYLGIAAVAGAVLVIARPWRMVSAGSVLLALARSPQLAGVLMAAMSSADEPEI